LISRLPSLLQAPTLNDFSGRVSDSGEGRWTAIAAIEEGVPAPVCCQRCSHRFASRDLDHFGNQLLSAMRNQFRRQSKSPPGERPYEDTAWPLTAFHSL